MRECVIVGSPNSGKTLFALNFAGFLGSKSVDITFRTFDGLLTCRHLTLPDARKELCSTAVHKTRQLQSMILKMSVGKAAVTFKLTDTCGLTEEIHPDPGIRKAMAQALGAVRSADFILHIVDLSRFNSPISPISATIDHEIYRYGLIRHNYIILANKNDLPVAKDNLHKANATFPQAQILPISALYSDGFREVKAYVARHI